jgi:hypothetical protein
MLFLFVSFIPFIPIALAHTYLLSPAARYQDLCQPTFDNSNCCAQKPNTPAITYTRGQIVNTAWGRNNHIGGFIRFSIVPLANSDIPGIFDNDSTVFQYNCYAPNCIGHSNSFFTGDPNYSYNGNRCTMNVKIPDWLPDGDYTFQWRWHSGGDSYNIRNLGLVDFVSCHDFSIRGGPLRPKPSCPLFVGGDASKPNLNACEFFKNVDINTCTDDKNCFGWFGKAPPKPSCNVLPILLP